MLSLNTETSIDRFEQLQQKLRDRWYKKNPLEEDDHDILVIPSFSVDQEIGKNVPGFLHYEERLLFSLMRLYNPHTRIIYVTALPLSPMIRDYYLQMLSGIPFFHAQRRLLLLSTDDGSFRPLTEKILERPRLVRRIRNAMRKDKSYIVCFNSTYLEQELSVKLDIPLFACSTQLLYWGSKSGSREIFAQGEIPHPDGSFLVTSITDLISEAAQLWERQPQLQRMVVKLNEGLSGEGNAILDLRPIQQLAHADLTTKKQAIASSLETMSFQGVKENWQTFSKRIPELGAIVEAFIEGAEKRSPSVQGYISPTQEVEILSTHDQILGGPDGQVYLGCRFPADDAYRLQIQNLGLKIGEVLAAKGAMERYGVDFIAVRQGKTWQLHAIEINLRKGGTTHPFMTLKLLTNGTYDQQTGLFYSPQGIRKYYVASDNLYKPQYKGLLPHDLMDIIAENHLHFDNSTKTGTVFHLMGALSEFGKLGLTSIGNSWEEAETIYQQIEAILDQETSTIINPEETESIPITWN
ncbi:MAG: carboxylate-amine ligase [Gloeocapsa sp. DLM2.Bin57]|nr:MAG: carboxylate-amine ligase [Gloeocapsa sp. DLM2.Bin57]